MSQNLPTLADLLHEVRAFLDGITPGLPEQDRYHALCCSHLLALAAREVEAGPALACAIAEARAALARHTGLSLSSEDELAGRLRDGTLDPHWEAALETVLRTVIARVRITKPGHLDPMHQEPAS